MKHSQDEYRIPKIEEFIDGFSFLIYSEGYCDDSIEDFWGWYSYTMGDDNWRDIDEIQSELEHGHILTKI